MPGGRIPTRSAEAGRTTGAAIRTEGNGVQLIVRRGLLHVERVPRTEVATLEWRSVRDRECGFRKRGLWIDRRGVP